MFGLADPSHLSAGELLHRNDRNGGCLLRLDGGRVAKTFPMKPWPMAWLRIVLRRTKAHKQARSMQRLLSLGLRTTLPLEVLVFAPCSSPFEGALIYEFVNEAVDARDALRTPLRQQVLDRLADELAVMANAGVLMVDLHLGNLLVDEAGGLIWIDVEVAEGARVVRKRLWSRLRRMHERCDRGVFDDLQWRSFCARIEAALENPERFHR